MSATEFDSAAIILSGDEMYRLGIAAAVGEEGGIDLITAHKWFNLAAMMGNLEARQHRAEVAIEMSADEIAQAQRLAREYLRLHPRAA
jgi:TPR repeat protein